MKKARYNRISSQTQNIARQLNKGTNDELLFNDVVSGSIPFKQRPEGLKLIEEIKNGQINYISVASIDRLGRNTLDILQTIEFFNNNGVTLRVDNLGIESIANGKPNSVFTLIASVMANIGQMERESILERQREGIQLAKLKGTYKGRVKGSIESDKDFLTKHKEVIKYINQSHSLRNVAKLSGVSLGTVQKVKRVLSA